MQQRPYQHGQFCLVRDHPHQVRGHCGAGLRQVTDIFHILFQVKSINPVLMKDNNCLHLSQNVPGYRADRGCPWPHPTARRPLLLRPKGERGQTDELPAELATAFLSILSPPVLC